jgi:hypothetical protein
MLALSAMGLAALLGTVTTAHAQTVQTALEPPTPLPLTEGSPPVLSTPPDALEDSDTASDQHRDNPRMFGGMFDVGVPDGAMLSFVYRPINLARFHAGGGYNGVSPGLRLGAALLPLGWGPSLGLEYGHYFEGDANGLVRMIGGSEEEDNVVLERFGYDFVSLRVGMELGGDRFTFFTRGGVSWIRSTIHDLDSLIEEEGGGGGNTTITIGRDPVLNAFAPSLNLGLIVQL